ncbi:MAG: hypothetical protein LBQ00_03340 [Syntrophobacterales bacterium]|nr:hypothetical protein [Syntrophobacterales bacterium]
MTRPPVIARFDDPNPVSMDKILEAVGFMVSSFTFKVECYGAAFGVPKRDMVNRFAYKAPNMALDSEKLYSSRLSVRSASKILTCGSAR